MNLLEKTEDIIDDDYVYDNTYTFNENDLE